MSDCCQEVLDGVAPGGGGGGTVAAGWTCVYEVDFRDVFASLGATDLNSVGSSFAFDGITWATPTIANSGVDMVTTATSFGITAGGLEVVGAVGGDLRGGSPTAAHIFAQLSAIAANSSTPFESDPTREYILQVFISAFAPDQNDDEAAVMLYKLDAVPDASQQTAYASLAQIVGVVDTPSFVGGNGGTLLRQNRTDLPPTVFDVPGLHHVATGHSIEGLCGEFGADWPANGDLRVVTSYADGSEASESIIGDPIVSFRIGCGFEGHAGAGLDATIQRLRVCQF